jgi:hypothetical protein
LTRKSILLSVFLGVGIGTLQQARSEPSPFPLQLGMRVPFEPTAFPSSGHTYLAYELFLTNFSGNPLTLRRVEVLDAAAFAGKDLEALLQPVGGSQDGKATASEIEAGHSLVVFMWVSFEAGAHVSKVGERVQRGQVMALIGASGDAREPHLHFEITNSAKALAGEGLPYVIDQYRVKAGNGWGGGRVRCR